MYTCAPEFRGLPWSYVSVLTKSSLIPLLAITLLSLLSSWTQRLYVAFSSLQKKNETQRLVNLIYTWHIFKTFEPEIIYNICLLFAFFCLSMMAMRLKLFLTPQMCILVSLFGSDKVVQFIPFIRDKGRVLLFFRVITFLGLCALGFDSIQKQHKNRGEYLNYPLEELLTWVQKNTHPSDVFAGPMTITASILLSTGRPIVNHPYYEDGDMRARTVQVYTVFSRKTSYEAYDALKGLGCKYVILERNKCFDDIQPRIGCKMIDLWDIEDSQNSRRPALCPQLFSGDAFPFTRVFQNAEYSVSSL